MRARNRYLFLLDIALCVLAFAMVIAVVFPIKKFAIHFVGNIDLVVATVIIYVLCMMSAGLYHVDWVFASVKSYARLISATVIACILSVILSMYLDSEILKINVTVGVCAMVMIWGVRFFVRFMYKTARCFNTSKEKRTLIIGAGSLAVTLLRDIYNNEKLNYDVVGLIDDDPKLKGQCIYGVRVLGNRDDIIKICNDYDVEEIIFAIHTIRSKERTEILDICSNTGKKVKILPGIEASLTIGENIKKVREIDIEDLLERDPVELDNDLLEADIMGKTVLVTGGGGSIGSELCRQIIMYKPAKLVIFDIYENTTYELQQELEEKYPEQELHVLIGSVRDKDRLKYIFETYHPDIVFHAAAHKHVPLMEYSPTEAIKNNVFGTYNTAVMAKEYGVRRFILISTDKAVNPTNVMGASKRMCEMIVQTLQQEGKTEFVAVRFGNVLGSNGSVIPRFKKQIALGGPVTVTHPEITRFFMTIPEAAQLVLQAGSYAKGGEIFVLDMGEPVKIYDLAKKIIGLSGYKVDADIKIEFTGLRAGEKLYEELLMSEEGLKKTRHSKIFVGKPIDITYDELKGKLERLEKALSGNPEEVKKIVAEVVPTYKYQ